MAAVEYRTWDFERLIRDVREGRLRVPRFQRGFVWTREQVLGLFESVAQRYPIGTLLVWDTEARFASREKVGPLQVPTDLPQVPLPVGYVLDGHQRLSALVGALGLTEDEASALKGGDRVFLVYVDLDDGRFVTPRRPEEQHLPVRLLVQQEPLTAWIDERRDATQPGTADRRRWDDRRARANRLQTTVAHTRVSYINLTGADLNEAVQVFTRLNSTATRASAAELFSALTWAPGAFDFSAEAEAALSTTDAFRSFGHSPVLRILLAALNESIYEVDWAKIKNRYSDQDLQGCMSRVATAWRTATELIGELIGATNGTVVPYALQLVVLAAFALDCPAPTEGQSQRLQRWLWQSSLGAAYAGGGGLAFERVVAQGRALARGEDGPVDRGPFRLAAFPRSFHPKSARVRAVHLFLAQRGPLNPANGKPVEAPLLKGMAGARMWPSFTGGTQSQRTPPSMASRVLVGLGPSALKQALDRLECQPFRDAVLRSHCIPVAAWEAWLRGDKELFLTLREEEIVREERAFAEAMGVEVPKEVEVDDEPEVDVEEDGPSAFG